MDRLIQMRKYLSYEGEKLQEVDKQQQDYERELERDRIAANRELEVANRELERDTIAALEDKADKDRELEEGRVAAEEAKLRIRIEAKEKDREI